MFCEDLQEGFSLYVDDKLTPRERAAYDAHLDACPVCRAELVKTRNLTRSLAALSRPCAPPDLAQSINRTLIIEAAAVASHQPRVPLDRKIIQWLEPRVMPYTVGAFASILLFALIFSALRPHLMALRDWETARREAEAAPYYVEDEDETTYDITKPISPEGYAARRAAYAAQSPSLDPRGALAALTWSPPRRRASDEDMIVVTDVYSNGSASLADVVQAPRDKRMLDDFQNALRKNPAFVPASLDRRPETMRVVFVLQKVNVSR
jgi:anti-sigma factor RsiW